MTCLISFLSSKKAVFLCLVCLLCLQEVKASKPILLTDERENYWITTAYFDTISGDKHVSEILNEEWVSLGDNSSAFVSENGVWTKFSITNNSTAAKRWMIEFPDGHVGEVELFEFLNKVPVLLGKGGARLPVSSKNYGHKNLWIDIPLQQGESKTYYAHFISSGKSSFVMSVRTSTYLVGYALVEYYFLGFFYGILAIILIYHMLLYVRLRQREFLTYGLYVLACLVYALREDMIGSHLFWGNLPLLNAIVELVAFPMLVLSYSLFSFAYLNLKKKYIKMGRLLIGFSLFSAALLVFKFILPQVVTEMLIILPHVFGFYVSYKRMKQGGLSERLFTIGSGVILIGLLNFSGIRLGLWYGEIDIIYTFYFGIVIQVIILSIASIEKWRALREEKQLADTEMIRQLKKNEELKNKVNKELESKVEERTEELKEKTALLEISNKKFQELTSELNELNSKLDLHNWKLQREVKEEKKSRLLSESVDYEDFMKLFPSDQSCMKYLEEKKWGDGFQCKKCGNHKYGKSDKLLARKCTKCKYTESPLIDTLFQGLKFPLSKAFYLLYSVVEDNQKSTIDEMSVLLSLRRNTCWGFRKKVEERIITFNSAKGRPPANWEELILNNK